MAMFEGCSFQRCLGPDGPMCPGTEPVILGDAANRNVAFPDDWTSARCDEWRKLHGMGVPTVDMIGLNVALPKGHRPWWAFWRR